MGNLLDKFERDNGLAKVKFSVGNARRVGLSYVFKFGKYKGMSLVDVLTSDRDYVRFLLENGNIEFTKKDDAKIRKILYDNQDNAGVF